MSLQDADRPVNKMSAGRLGMHHNMAVRIKQLREAKGVTQHELAKHLGVSRSAVTQWEARDSSPNLGLIERMALFLNTTAEYIAFGVESEASKLGAAEEGVSVRVVEIDADKQMKAVGTTVVPIGAIDPAKVRNLAQLRAVALVEDPSLPEARKGDIVVFDTSDTTVSDETPVILWSQRKPRLAKATIPPFGTDAVSLRLNAKDYEVKQDELDILGRAVAIIHSWPAE